MRATALAGLCAVTILAGGLPTAAQAPPDQWTEFPAYERAVVSLLRNGNRVKRARQQLVAAPSAPETVELLLQTEMVSDAVRILPAALAGNTDQVVQTLRALMSNAWMFTLDDTRGHRDAIRRAVEPVRARMPSMSAEDAARLAFVLMSFDNWIGRQGSQNWGARLSDFVKQYAGTDAALLAEVDALSFDAPRLRRLEPLEQFWREHPGTTAGAKALYQVGFHLHTINMLEARGGDPTDRLLRVADVVRELESGRYPRSEWVDRAPSLMIGFFISSSPGPTYAPGNVERALETFERFVMGHFADASPGVDNGIGYLIASKMADLYERQGDRIGGVEGLLTRLEAQPASRQAARRLRASFYLQEWTAAAEPVPQMGARARATFEALAAEGTEPGASHSLASLAAMAYSERDYARAIPLYRRYVDTYPRSSYAWVAMIRLGQCYEAQDNWASAAETFERAAAYSSAGAPAGVFANTLAGRSLDALGDPGRALEAYRRAVAAWDPDYGEEYGFYAWQQQPSTPPTQQLVDRNRVSKSQLVDRVTMLERAVAVPGGTLFERGDWQLRERRFAEARASFSQLVEEFPGSPLAPLARSRSHLAELERAVELAGIENAQADDAAAMKLFDGLSGEPVDFAAGAADVAAATLLFKRGVTDEATTRMSRGLTRLAGLQPAPTRLPAFAALDADVVAIRALVFRPAGDLALLRKRWNAFTFPDTLPPFVVLKSDVTVKIASAEPMRRTVYQRFADIPNAILLTTEELAVMARVLNATGGTRTREPRQIMETPHQPVGPAVDILGFWSKFFPARGGHWGGWVLETYPIINRIEFLDEARTKANVLVEVGYSGGTLVLEKIDGVWKVIRLTNEWIT